jgi:3D (Asp-Asp-Asp) domain-containing protein
MALLLTRSGWWKALVMILAVAAFVWLYEENMLDSKFSMLPRGFEGAMNPAVPPAPGERQAFSATAYCKGLVTASGVAAQTGVVASDPALLPIGSVVEIGVDDPRYDGIYTVLDTGPEIQGRDIDIYMWSCIEALKFGRRPARVTVLRLGWNPRATTPSFINRLFRRPEPESTTLPARPLPLIPTPPDAAPPPPPSSAPPE